MRILAAIRSIPKGRVTSYGLIARLAGMPNGARQVVRALHTSSGSQDLPWFRLLRKDGSIALPQGEGFELQKALLEAEGVKVGKGGKVDLASFGWDGTAPNLEEAPNPDGPGRGPRRSGSHGGKAAPRTRRGAGP
ncbi:MAG TPA: MGMT family protein, partial [Rectinemataceae bacterium]|nr:MGMT family protein [Rectinemataceae bacterium]